MLTEIDSYDNISFFFFAFLQGLDEEMPPKCSGATNSTPTTEDIEKVNVHKRDIFINILY